LLQCDFPIAVEWGLAIGTESDDGKHRAVAKAPALLLRISIAGFEDLLRKALKIVFVEIVPLRSEFGVARAATDEGTVGRRPPVKVDGDKVA